MVVANSVAAAAVGSVASLLRLVPVIPNPEGQAVERRIGTAHEGVREVKEAYVSRERMPAIAHDGHTALHGCCEVEVVSVADRNVAGAEDAASTHGKVRVPPAG